MNRRFLGIAEFVWIWAGLLTLVCLAAQALHGDLF